jgi:GTP-binding protein
VDLAYALVFTKTDKQSPTRTRTSIATFLEAIAEFTAEPPPVFSCSSLNKEGREEIMRHIAAVLSETQVD